MEENTSGDLEEENNSSQVCRPLPQQRRKLETLKTGYIWGDSGFRKDTCQPSLGQLLRCSIFMGGSNMQALQVHQDKGVDPGLIPGTVGGCGSRL